MVTLTPGPVRLTEWTRCGGCAAKWGPGALAEMVAGLEAGTDADLLVGLAPFDDAAVYRVSDDVAVVSTTDFFPPLVDDPSDFGAIAAANACSDVFAMGARVAFALNIAAFPEALPSEAIAAILSAAADVVTAAGGVVAGGHTIRSEEPIFGLAVQGLVHPDRVLTKSGARAGDALVLSKPIGTGIVLAGGNEASKAAAVAGMRTLNRQAAEALVDLGPSRRSVGLGAGGAHAVTDVTGFGLLGHASEVAEHSGVRIVIDAAAVPLYPGALAAATAGTRTGGDAHNRAHLASRATCRVDLALDALAHDPQTSGGLLAAVAPESVSNLVDQGFVAIGTVEEGTAHVELV